MFGRRALAQGRRAVFGTPIGRVLLDAHFLLVVLVVVAQTLAIALNPVRRHGVGEAGEPWCILIRGRGDLCWHASVSLDDKLR